MREHSLCASETAEQWLAHERLLILGLMRTPGVWDSRCGRQAPAASDLVAMKLWPPQEARCLLLTPPSFTQPASVHQHFQSEHALTGVRGERLDNASQQTPNMPMMAPQDAHLTHLTVAGHTHPCSRSGFAQEAWAHLAREAPSCIAHLDGAVLPPAVSARLGLPTGPDGAARELLVVGTSNGDCMFVDATAGGTCVLRWVGWGSWGLLSEAGACAEFEKTYGVHSSRKRFVSDLLFP